MKPGRKAITQQYSSVLIKVDDGYPIDIVSIDIRRQIDGIQIIKTQNIISGIAEGIESFSSFLYIFACGCGNTARQLAHLIYCRAAASFFQLSKMLIYPFHPAIFSALSAGVGAVKALF